ncbi:MAG: hypothetical protein Q8R58_03075 [Sulfuricurvum sp.]|jgi:hypothetical protein|nr:hypothetical protein [Sulfuricurvum sp.]MDP3587010.1 hypothetical protein [Sulfuricurvum sp.]
MKKHNHEMRSKFLTLENHFLNTFFSGLYLSAGDFIRIAAANGLDLKMHSREMLIKELLNETDKLGTIGGVVAALNRLIDERITAYHRLSLEYPAARVPLAKLAQKATGTKSLLARDVRGNPYE